MQYRLDDSAWVTGGLRCMTTVGSAMGPGMRKESDEST